jgi:hypothetical protein
MGFNKTICSGADKDCSISFAERPQILETFGPQRANSFRPKHLLLGACHVLVMKSNHKLQVHHPRLPFAASWIFRRRRFRHRT